MEFRKICWKWNSFDLFIAQCSFINENHDGFFLDSLVSSSSDSVCFCSQFAIYFSLQEWIWIMSQFDLCAANQKNVRDRKSSNKTKEKKWNTVDTYLYLCYVTYTIIADFISTNIQLNNNNNNEEKKTTNKMILAMLWIVMASIAHTTYTTHCVLFYIMCAICHTCTVFISFKMIFKN